jgi:hypothetical protein
MKNGFRHDQTTPGRGGLVCGDWKIY